MGQGISEVLTFAVGVAISPVPIIAVILMLFSVRAKVNGPMFLLGWASALTVVSFAVYFAADASDPSTSSGASDTISWGKVVLGALLLVLAMRTWGKRPAPGEQPDMPKWMDGSAVPRVRREAHRGRHPAPRRVGRSMTRDARRPPNENAERTRRRRAEPR